MKKILTLVLLLTLNSSSAYQATQINLSSKINTLLKNADKTVSIGILIKDQESGKVLFQKNPDHYFMPASNEKLFTAAAALKYLTENFTYKTQLYLDTSKIQNGVLNDDLWLKFSGDPTLNYQQLDALIQTLSKAGIHQISGNIIIDDTAFDETEMSPGSTWDDKDFCWGAPIHAINIEHNCVKTTITPATTTGQLAILTFPNYPQSLQFLNNATTQAANTENCTLDIKRNENNYLITGCVKATMEPKKIEMAINNPRVNAQFLLAYLFNKYQISFNTNFKFNKINSSEKLFANINSPTLSTLVTIMLKESDNTIANSLFKTMGANYTNNPGSFKNGSEAVRNILRNAFALDIPNTTLIDGNGGSRYDFLTPRQIVTLLQKAYSSEQAKIFISALPIGGVDGTLKERMKDSTTLGKVQAKTGTATAVSTLSGYIKTQKKHTLVFSIMINGFIDMPNKYQNLQDQLCTLLIENA